MNAKGPHTPLGQLRHGPVRVLRHRINHRGAGERILMHVHHVQHVAVVKSIEAHLNEVDAGDSRGPAMLEELLRREGTVLALEVGKTLLLDKDNLLKEANAAQLTITGLQV